MSRGGLLKEPDHGQGGEGEQDLQSQKGHYLTKPENHGPGVWPQAGKGGEAGQMPPEVGPALYGLGGLLDAVSGKVPLCVCPWAW